MKTDHQSLRGLLGRALIFVLLLLLTRATFEGLNYLAARREAERPAPVQPDQHRHQRQGKAVKAMAETEVVFGSKYPRHGHWFDATEDLYMLGALYPASGGPATEVGRWQSGLWPNWPPAVGHRWTALDPDSPAIWASYDPTSHEVLRAGAYIDVEIGGDPIEPLDWNDIMLGVYDQSGSLAGHSETVTVYAADGEQEVEFSFGETFTIDPEASYYLFVWTRYGPGACHVGVGYGSFPVSFAEEIRVEELLRLAVRFGEEIPVGEKLRLGLSFAENVTVSETLKTRLKPSARTGFCTGHHVSDEDAGGTIE
jgi:hypothetical protein